MGAGSGCFSASLSRTVTGGSDSGIGVSSERGCPACGPDSFSIILMQPLPSPGTLT